MLYDRARCNQCAMACCRRVCDFGSGTCQNARRYRDDQREGQSIV